MNSFSIFDSPLSPRMIIEASAGTGKTYTITGLYIRLLLEKRVPLGNLLVITFTRMATKELKERILKRLRESLRALESGRTHGDPFLEALVLFCGGDEEAPDILRESVRNFDEARIYTIHGYCRQVLREESLMTGVPFDMEVIQEDPLLLESAEDFWRSFVHRYSGSEAGNCLITKAMEFGADPAELLNTLMPVIRQPAAVQETSEECEPLKCMQQLLDLKRELAAMWCEEREQILYQLSECGVNGISGRHLAGRVAKMDSFLSEDIRSGKDSFKQLKYFLPSYFRNNLKNGCSRLPEHMFFKCCEEYSRHLERIPAVKAWFLEKAAEDILELRREKGLDSSTLSYDDLLAGLDKALASPGIGPVLAERLRRSYPYALVDEFQDTDPVQYRILDRIYSEPRPQGSSLMLIGDPKQAIYAFRGADLYAYLRARTSVDGDGRYTLLKNYRSTPGLIKAVNALFRPDHQTPFLEDKITYHKIGAGNSCSDSAFLKNEKPVIPFRIFHQDGDGTKAGLRSAIFSKAARQIMKMVKEGGEGKITLPDENSRGRERKLAAGDIAVIIHSHKDAEIIKTLLKKYGVAAVTYSREKVFESREAERMEQIFTAILDPADTGNLYTALASGFFGNRLSSMLDVQNSESSLLSFTEKLLELNDRWFQAGCYPMMRKLFFEMNALEQLSRQQDGDRLITNLFQLTELAAYAEQEYRLDPPALLRWFRRKMAGASADEEETLRLESDENLVKIVTVHNSKGLEFPVVFCPALWSVRNQSKRGKPVETYHAEEDPFDLIVSLEQERTARRRKAEHQARFEEVSEEVRKTYVAVTRAKYECRIFWGTTSAGNLSGLGALLFGKEEVKKFIRDKIKAGGKNGPRATDFKMRLKKLADENPGLISYEELEEEESEGESLFSDEGAGKLSCQTYEGKKNPGINRRLHSFSSLMDHKTVASEPDYEQYLEDFADYASGRRNDGPADIFHFPRGKTAGTFIHRLFEHPAMDFRDSQPHGGIIEELIGDYGFDRKWIPVLKKMIADVVRADYGHLELRNAGPGSLLKEMEFCFPVAEPELENVRSVIGGEGTDGLPKKKLQGYMTGFVDLIVRQKGIYYILDYKSNYLGDALQDYRDEVLRAEMAAAGYDIQYHLYTTAFKKFMENRRPSFDYESEFGGVFYLFVRGMKAGTASGIYFDKPCKGTITELEKILSRKMSGRNESA
ncbi:MAG: exodeoxyribonuclease V subunit beta [Balneolaceae bacterium]